MEPQRNIELPKVEGGFSNNQFESYNFDQNQNYETQYSAQKIDIMKSREAAFSAYEKFSPQAENDQSQASIPVLPEPQQDTQHIQAVNSVPATAADIDLMEDEWVKDLKKMIVETKGDPYMREIRFKRMQVDYLRKRYNRIIGGGK